VSVITPPKEPKPNKLQYGWVIVGVMMLVQTVSSGLGFYNMSVYINRLAVQLSVPLADISFAVSLFFVVGGIAGLFVAELLNRFHVRTLMIVGALVSGVAIGAVGWATQLWQVYALFAIFGIGNAGISIVIATTLITQWFPGPERSMALAMTSTGLSLGGVVLTPYSAYLMNTIGLGQTMPILGLILIGAIVPLSLFIRQVAKPTVDTLPNQGGSVANGGFDRNLFSQAVNSRFFILLAGAYILIMAAQVGGIAHLYSRVESLAGFTYAAYAVQALSICSISGRFLGGWLVSRIPIRWFALGNLTLQALGLTFIALAPTGTWAVVAAGFFGLSVGNLLMTQPLWLAEVYATSIYAKVFARANALSVLGLAVGPYFIGWAFDNFGAGQSYFWPYMAAVACSIFAFAIVLVASSSPVLAHQEAL
jgi:MFS family permease|tara:strand:+ start:13553 stop:14818 length:1266 start_codon:yes stop_codon:yes gene_type:complete